MLRPLMCTSLLALVLLGAAGESLAHWCSNIFTSEARLVVKPAQTTIVLSPGAATALRVYVQNNFPYRLVNTELRGTASGYTITSTPASQSVYPGQKTSFVLSITPSSGPTGTVQSSTMGIQIRFRTGGSDPSARQGDAQGWMSSSQMMNETPSRSQVESGTTAYQSGSLSVALFADMWPTDSLSESTAFGRTGLQQLIQMFGYRFCYNFAGVWRCSGQNCPSPCAEGAPWAGGDDRYEKNCMRAGFELAARKPVLGSTLTAARDGATNALRGTLAGCPSDCPINHYKCLAAVIGAYLWEGAGSTAAFTTELNASANHVPTICRDAALRILGGTTASTCASGSYWERAACAAAEGLRNNMGPVTSVLMARSGDGETWSGAGLPASDGMESLFYSGMLYVVASHHRNTSNTIPFYPDAGASLCTSHSQCDDNNPCTTDTCDGNQCQNTPVSGCCTSPSQCNDNDPCTSDTCASNQCQHTIITGCCTRNDQCNDANDCTTDSCQGNVCQHTPIAGCCTEDAMCADNDPCTTDTCDTATGICSNLKQSGCCTYDTDCDDEDSCTLDTCDTSTQSCLHVPVPCSDAGLLTDAGLRDSGAQGPDGHLGRDSGQQPGARLEGGCSVGGSSPLAPLTWLTSLALCLALLASLQRRRGSRR